MKWNQNEKLTIFRSLSSQNKNESIFVTFISSQANLFNIWAIYWINFQNIYLLTYQNIYIYIYILYAFLLVFIIMKSIQLSFKSTKIWTRWFIKETEKERWLLSENFTAKYESVSVLRQESVFSFLFSGKRGLILKPTKRTF